MPASSRSRSPKTDEEKKPKGGGGTKDKPSKKRRRTRSPTPSRESEASSSRTHSSEASSTRTADGVILEFLETRLNELARRMEDLVKFEHALQERQRDLDLQTANLQYYRGYVRGLSSRGGARGGGSGYRGRNFRGNSSNFHFRSAPAPAPDTASQEAQPDEQQHVQEDVVVLAAAE